MVEKTVTDVPSRDFWHISKELLAVVGGLIGVFVAVFWAAGRGFASGYFASMNIPAYHVDFAWWDYAGISWYIWLALACCFALAFTLLALASALLGISIRRLFRRKDKPSKHPKQSGNMPRWINFRKSYKVEIMVVFTSILTLLSLSVFLTLQFAVQFVGQESGRNVVLNAGIQVDLSASKMLNLSSTEVLDSPSGGERMYVYSDYRLLTYNGGHYYLFNELDYTTCKPKRVFVISSSDLVQVNLESSVSIGDKCLPNSILDRLAHYYFPQR